MKKNKTLVMVFLGALLLLSGCGDQLWCGDEGCNASSGKPVSKNQ